MRQPGQEFRHDPTHVPVAAIATFPDLPPNLAKDHI